MALWEQGGTGGFQQRKTIADNDAGSVQRSTVKGVLTCTIATILNAKHSESDNCFVYKHLKFNTVMIMGLIREANHEVNGSLATYQIDDLSGGLIEVKWWHDDSSESLSSLTYVKIVGQVKVFSGKAHIVAHHIHKIRSLNELVAHSIECIHASMSIRKGDQSVGHNNHPIVPTNGGVNGFTPVQNAVLNLLKTATTQIGFSISEICKQLKQFSENNIQQTLDFLSGEGHIYSTTDDEHFRAAN